MQLTITICCDLVKVWAFIDKWKTCNIFSPNFPRSNCVLHFAWNLQLCLIHIYISTYTIFVCNWNFICANCLVQYSWKITLPHCCKIWFMCYGCVVCLIYIQIYVFPIEIFKIEKIQRIMIIDKHIYNADGIKVL